jgi:aspartate/methionine/tyrosine aminotransferase
MLERARQLLTPSSRSDVPPFMVMDVIAAATRVEAAGHHVIHMEVGQPAAPAPRSAIEAARRALEGPLRYTEALGLRSLRERIARHYAETHNVELDPARVIVTTGSSAGFILAFLTMFEPGDRVGIANPGYPPYRHILKALGCEPVLIETGEETRWAVTPEAVLAEHRRKKLAGLLVASPANPTGTMMAPEALEALIRMADEAGIRFISDEIYHGLDYAFAAETALRLSDNALVINSFSKYFCMTGWRIGWMVAPESLVRPIERLQGNLAISLLIEGLPKVGLDKFLPVDGAFYLYANVARFSDDSHDFAQKMLQEAHVAATPGIDFDPVDGQHYLRFCYAGAAAEMSEAVRRIGAWLSRR